MVTAVALGLTLAFEPTEPGAMRRPTRAADQLLLLGFVVWRIVFVSILFVIGTFGMFSWTEGRGPPLAEARTLAVNTIVVMEIFYLFSVRFQHGPSLTWRGLLRTPAVLIGVGVVVLLQLAFTYAPTYQALFDAKPVGLTDGLAVVGTGIALLAILEIEKLVLRNREARTRS